MHVSVITPAYNVAAFVGTAIGSVCMQTHDDWSMVVVDDGSTDGTAAAVRAWTDPRVRLICQDNAGVSAARNRGLAEHNGDAVLFLDADDWLAPDALSRLVQALRGDVAAAYGPYAFVTEDGARVVYQKRGPFPYGDILPRLLVRNLFANGGHLLLRAAAAAEAGEFRRDLVYGEDWEYWCRVASRGEFALARGTAPLLFVRQRHGGAFLRLASDPRSFAPCTEAIFANPTLIARLGASRAAALRRRTDAENAWIVGRELIRHGRRREGQVWLQRSFTAQPSVKRAALLAATHALPLLPDGLHGPFRAYQV
ncbi:MAG: glycosyltransferase family 2 protein [Alphaproteobacteria bacterium]|nr:glycosyltransferase family 2 protein [Alphaproteobacteria bacterium]